MAMTVTMVIGAIVIDLGIWLSERRGAQTAADFSALGGAQELLPGSAFAERTAAFDNAVRLAVANHVDPSAIDSAPTSSCSPDNTCINVGSSDCYGEGTDSMPWVEAKVRRPGPELFTTAFGVPGPDIGAVARACVGSLLSSSDLAPYGIQTNSAPANGAPETGTDCHNGTDDDGDGEADDGCPLSDCMEPDPDNPARTRPVYGAVCVLKTSGQGGVGGVRGQLTLTAGTTGCSGTSANDMRHNFHYGAGTFCEIGQEVNTGTGTINGLLQGLEDRLSEEGKCDQIYYAGNPGYDDFDEVFSIAGGASPVVPSNSAVFTINPCHVTTGVDVPADNFYPSHTHTYAPRAVDLILVDEFEPGNESQTVTITGFAAFYVIGCFLDDTSASVKTLIEADLTDFGLFLNRCRRVTGQYDVLGIFVKSLKPPENVGDPDPNSPVTIVLVK
jgi:hypothetical protein